MGSAFPQHTYLNGNDTPGWIVETIKTCRNLNPKLILSANILALERKNNVPNIIKAAKDGGFEQNHKKTFFSADET